MSKLCNNNMRRLAGQIITTCPSVKRSRLAVIIHRFEPIANIPPPRLMMHCKCKFIVMSFISEP